MNRRHTVGLLAIASAMLLTVLAQRQVPINHDVAWILTVADLKAGGAELYQGLFELNPPLVFWMASGARAVAGPMGAEPDFVFRAAVLVLLAASAAAVWWLTGSVIPACGVVLLFGLLTRNEFGQRDVLAAVLLAPYVASAARRERDSLALALVLGVSAGLAVVLKPFYGGVWLLAALLRRRPIADLAVITTGAMYLVAVAVLTPSYTTAVRDYGALYFAWIDWPWARRLADPRMLLACASGVLAVLLTRSGRAPRWVFAMGIAALGSALAFALQGKGFSYHAIPALGFAGIASAGALGRARALAWPLAAVSALLLWRTTGQRQVDVDAIPVIRAELAETPGRALFLTHHLQRAWPMFRETGRPWLAPVPSMWWVSVRPDPALEHGRVKLMGLVAAAAREADVVLIEARPHDVTPGAPGLDRMIGPSLAAVLAEEFQPVDSTSYLYRWQRKPPD